MKFTTTILRRRVTISYALIQLSSYGYLGRYEPDNFPLVGNTLYRPILIFILNCLFIYEYNARFVKWEIGQLWFGGMEYFPATQPRVWGLHPATFFKFYFSKRKLKHFCPNKSKVLHTHSKLLKNIKLYIFCDHKRSILPFLIISLNCFSTCSIILKL